MDRFALAVDSEMDSGNAVRSILLDDTVDAEWSKRAQAEYAEARSETVAVRPTGRIVETDHQTGRTRWWTFGGLRVNYSLALMLRTTDELSLASTTSLWRSLMRAAFPR